MIDLTPLEVRKKKGDFRKAMRGYDGQSVDDFLDLVADRLEELVRENSSLHERIANVESQVADYRDRERALTEALVTAQEMREEMRRQMEREAELKRREAEADAEAIRADAGQMREREEENVRRLRARQSQFVQSYRAFLERELAEIGVMAETLDLSSQALDAPRKRTKRVERPGATQQVSLPEPTPMPEPPRMPEPAPMPDPTPRPNRGPAAAAAPTAIPALDLDAFAPLEPEPFEREPVEPGEPDALAFSDAPFGAEYAAPTEELPTLPDEELIDLSKHLPATPEPEDDIIELELMDEIDEKTDDDDDDSSDGWVSTLLEGKGD